MDEQEYPQAPSQPEQKDTHLEQENNPTQISQTQPENQEKKSKKWVVILVLVLLLAGILAWFIFAKDSATNENTQTGESETSQLVVANRPVVCIELGLESLQCENVNSGEVFKYVMPESFRQITKVTPSPDGTKMLVSQWKVNVDREIITIVDSSFNTISELPFEGDPESTITFGDVGWLDNETVVNRSDGGIYLFDTTTEKNSLTIKQKEVADIESIMPAWDGKTIYGIKATADEEQDSVIRSLVEIDVENKTIIDISSEVTLEEIGYNPETSLFFTYTASSEEDSQASTLAFFGINGEGNNKRLEQSFVLQSVYPVATQAYTINLSAKGLLASHEEDYLIRAPLYVYADENNQSDLKLAVSGVSFLMTLPDFPELQKAETNEATTGDFYKPPAGIPTSADKFLTSLVSGSECKTNEYVTLDHIKYYKSEQIGVSESGCGSDFYSIYINKKGRYEQVATTQEGIGCDQAEELGINPEIIECREGEGDHGL